MPKTRKISEEIRKLVIKLKNEGKSLQKIGDTLNLQKSTVKQ